MPQQDAEQIKERIVFFLRKRGASLPVHIAKEIQANSLFTSAFLSELYSEKRINMSDMRVGSSPVYYLPGQNYMLERFSEHLKSKEKDAYILLKEKKFLRDEGLHPAIRVALRAITDFAIPFHRNSKIYWRYYLVPEAEFTEEAVLQIVQIPLENKEEKPASVLEVKKVEPIAEKIEIIINPETHEDAHKLTPLTEPITEIKPEKKPEKKETKKPKPKPKKANADKKEEGFFNKVKEYLSKKSIEILDIEGIKKDELVLRIKKEKKEELLIAYNKKKISEDDIIKAHKKAKEADLPYSILNLSGIPKKMQETIDALRDISSIEKI